MIRTGLCLAIILAGSSVVTSAMRPSAPTTTEASDNTPSSDISPPTRDRAGPAIVTTCPALRSSSLARPDMFNEVCANPLSWCSGILCFALGL
mmetsp:Transcript_92998/g.129099  ORF Transcript_92998/g.129099 Transcript_92998/m.129099 type:complete len:93 (-) Transcript_92998:168-446(-)